MPRWQDTEVNTKTYSGYLGVEWNLPHFKPLYCISVKSLSAAQ